MTISPYHAAKAIAKSMVEHPDSWTFGEYTVENKTVSIWIGSAVFLHAYQPATFYFGWRGWWIVRKALRELKAVKTIEMCGCKLSDI